MKKIALATLIIALQGFTFASENHDKIDKLEFQIKQIAFTVEDLEKAVDEISIKTDKQYGQLRESIKYIEEEIKKIKNKTEKKEKDVNVLNENRYIVAVRKANLRKEPDIKSSIVSQLTYGTEVQVVDETRYFYKVKTENLMGYIYKTLLVKK